MGQNDPSYVFKLQCMYLIRNSSLHNKNFACLPQHLSVLTVTEEVRTHTFYSFTVLINCIIVVHDHTTPNKWTVSGTKLYKVSRTLYLVPADQWQQKTCIIVEPLIRLRHNLLGQVSCHSHPSSLQKELSCTESPGSIQCSFRSCWLITTKKMHISWLTDCIIL